MSRLIRDGQFIEDCWRWLDADEAPAPAPGEHLILPSAVWQARRPGLDAARSGVWLAPDDGLAPILPWLATLPLIAIRFPVFTDGRGYSLARLLRGRHGYAGELRAVGDVLRDQLYFLQRAGFDSFALRADQPAEEALAAFRDYRWTPLSRG